jgi:peptide-methionine (S)-S-oxide reductase
MRFLCSVLLVLLACKSYAETQTIIVAGGCFWCVESDYEKYKGVVKAESGYINGTLENPTYKEVSSKKTGHFEAVKITYNSDQVSLEELTEYFWKTIDPTDASGQFCDKGTPYKTALFYQNPQQEIVFQQSLNNLNKTKPFAMPIVTEILPAETFYLAEDYHQDYYKKNPLRYKYYRSACGRDARIKNLWGEVASYQYH